jgi:mycothione reductase
MFVLPADRVVEADDARRLGVTFAGPTVDWPGIRDRIFGRIDPISAGGEAYRLGQEHTTLYRSHAVFTGERRLALATGEEVTADRVVVAAGSHPVGLDVDGLRAPDPGHGIHTSDTVMRLDTLPPRMAVIGGGFVACEMAHVFAALGVAVTQVQRGPALLRHHEVEVSQRYTEVARHRYDVRLSTTPTAAERVGGVWRIDLAGPGGHSHVEAEVVLLAVGRVPNTDRLDPAAGGLEVHDDGRLAGEPRTTDDRPIPSAVFGHPQVASFGPTAAELDAAATPYVTATQAVGDVAYGWALEDTTGLLTIHADHDGRILAAHAIGPQASTVIQPLVQAATFGQRAHDVARGQYWIHPALAEVVENALLGLPLPAPA